MDKIVEAKQESSPSSLQLITYQLGELSKSVEKLSISLEHNNIQLNERLTALELWKAGYGGAKSDLRYWVATGIAVIVAAASVIAVFTGQFK